MSLSKGINSFAGFGGETTPGTKGTIDLWHRIVDMNLKHQKDLFVSESLSPDWHTLMFYGAGKNVGSVVFEQTYTGLELWWHALMGTYTYGVNTPVSGANTHTMTYAPTTNNHPSLSFEAVRGIGGSKEIAYLGIRPTKATIEFAPKKPMRTTFELYGMGISRGAAAAATFPTFRPVLPAHKTTLTANGTAVSVLSGRVEIETPRAEDREHYGDSVFKDGVITGRPAGTFQLEVEFGDDSGADTDALLALYEAGTKLSGFVLTHQGDIVTGSTKYQFGITVGGAYIEDATPSSVGNKITGATIVARVTDSVAISFINATTQVT